MTLPTNITQEHLLQAIEKIDREGIPKEGASQYYDVIHDGKRYPPKLIVSYANIFANGEMLDRGSFGGGLDQPSFKLLKKEGFIIQEKTKVWFVTQGSTFTTERGMKFLFAPKVGDNGRTHFYWDNVFKVRKGDIIFNYSNGLKGVSLAKNDGYETVFDDPSNNWNKEGYRVDLELIVLDPPIERETIIREKDKFIKYLYSVTNKPFTTQGSINQGYLYEFTKEAGRFVRDLYGKEFGNSIIDIFFDSIELNTLKDISSVPAIKLKFNYKDFRSESSLSNLYLSENLIIRFIASLQTKPFVILTGLSGSGKTKLAQAFAMWICESETQYKIVPVGADWTNREPLVGYPNGLDAKEYITPDSGVINLLLEAVKKGNENKPFFLILDEMNLSHVERYFADFLSIMESNDSIKLYTGKERSSLDGIPIPFEIGWPKNVFIIGTVNIDETTYMFSPKVLDRANVIEFRITEDEIKSFLGNPSILNLTKLTKQGVAMAESYLSLASQEDIAENELIANELVSFFRQLQPVGAEFGYRSATEIMQLAAKLKMLEPSITDDECLDIAIMQKLLPKLHGSRSKLVKILIALAGLCVEGITKEEFEKKFEEFYKNGFDALSVKYPISFEKLIRMYKNVLANGFTSYAEA